MVPLDRLIDHGNEDLRCGGDLRLVGKDLGLNVELK